MSTIADCAKFGWDLRVGCRYCNRLETWTHVRLARRFRQSLGADVDELARRLRCSICQGPCHIQLVQGAVDWRGHDGPARREVAFAALLAEIDAEAADG